MSGPSRLKIGVLVPASRAMPELDRDFLNGLTAALAEAGVPHELAVEPIGVAAVKDVVVDKVQRLLLQFRPHVVTAVLGTAMMRHVQSFFSSSRTPLIVNNLGADPLLHGGAPNPYVFHNTYNLWQSCCALGYWAAQNVGTRVAHAVALHESGYGIVYAFFAGFTAGGGTVVATEVTHRNSSTEDPTEALQRLAGHAPDFIMGFYSGKEGISFMRAYEALGLQMPLLASPMMLHDRWLSQMDGAATGVRTAFSWPPRRPDPAFDAFRDRCRQIAPEEPGLLSVLGYETGSLVCAAAAHGTEGEGLAAALTTTEIASPRGMIRMDPQRRVTTTKDYLLRVAAASDTTYAVELAGGLDLPSDYWQVYDAFSSQEVRSGWINPYLVT